MKTESKSAKRVEKLTLRVPAKLKSRLIKRAEKENRTMNAQAIALLEQSLNGRAA